MAEITSETIRCIEEAFERKEHIPLTPWEKVQLARAWTRLRLIEPVVLAAQKWGDTDTDDETSMLASELELSHALVALSMAASPSPSVSDGGGTGGTVGVPGPAPFAHCDCPDCDAASTAGVEGARDTEALDEDTRDALLAEAAKFFRYDGTEYVLRTGMDSNEVVNLMTGIPLPARYGPMWPQRKLTPGVAASAPNPCKLTEFVRPAGVPALPLPQQVPLDPRIAQAVADAGHDLYARAAGVEGKTNG